MCGALSRCPVRVKSKHVQRKIACPLRAKSGHGKCGLFRSRSRCSRKDNPDVREFAWLCIDLDRAAVLFDDDIVTDGKSEPCPFAGGLGGKERIEHFVFDLGWNSHSIVADPDLHTVPKAFG